LAILSINGCSLFRKSSFQQLGYREQKDIILKIVPLETSREIVLKKLKQAGITGDFSPYSQSVYYCQFRAHSGGKKQPLSIELLFNEKGIFYATQNGDAQIDAQRAHSR